jgi:succinoglycan biosynthesis transport protein ExoP
MEDEIDLRAYIAILLKYKYWIVGLALGAAILALGVSFVWPPTYEATALVAITKPRYTMRFDPRLETVADVTPPYQAYPALALGDELLTALIGDLGSKLTSDEQSITAIRDMVDAKNGTDPSIVELTVKNGDPERTALIVNRWATLFVDKANDLYGQSQEELSFFEAQATEAQDALTKAEQDVVDFQARNEASILQTQLNNKQAALNDYLSVARSVRLIIQDSSSLQDRLRAQDAATRASLSDELSSLFLEIDALNRGQLPIQLQITGQQGLSNKTVGEQITFLDSLIQVLESKQAILEQEAKSLEPDILSLQERLQEVRTEEARLDRAKQVAQETYMTLARKVDEVRVSAQDTTRDVRLASMATVPDEPASPHKLLNTVIGGALGLAIGVFGAFAIEYWRQGKPESAGDR